MLKTFSILMAGAALITSASAQSAITADPPQDKVHPAHMDTVQVPSHGVLLNGLVYVAAGAGPHPVVILLHGFPGNEKNLDLAQTLRRAGWDVLFFNYRGSWGTPGAFSFTHAMEDTQAAIAYMRDPATAARLHADPARIVLIGHSMGGLMAAWAGAHDAKIAGVGLISAADMAGRAGYARSTAPDDAAAMAQVAHGLAAEGMAPLAGCTPESLARELLDHSKDWALPGFAAALATRPVFLITSDDGLAPSAEALLSGLKRAGDTRVSLHHLATDHAYSDQRIALQQQVLDGLALMQKP